MTTAFRHRPVARWRRAGAATAIVAVLLYVAAPFMAQAPARAAQTIEICTLHGIVSIPAPGDDAPASPSGMAHCPACALAALGKVLAKAAGVPAIGPALLRSAGIAVAFGHAERRTDGLAVSANRSRGPPLTV